MTSKPSQGVTADSAAGNLGGGSSSGLGARRGSEPPRFGSVFRSVMSSPRLDTMIQEHPASLAGTSESRENLTPSTDTPSPTTVSPPPATLIGSLFRSVKSCSRLDELDKTVTGGMDAQGEMPPASAPTARFWLGGFNSLLEKSRITERDLNVMAPSSS